MSKRQVLKDQYDSIKDTIIKNVETIKGLLNQANSLTDLVNKIQESDPVGSETQLVSQLRENIQDIYETIGKLVDQTTQLFDHYESFAEKVFNE